MKALLLHFTGLCLLLTHCTYDEPIAEPSPASIVLEGRPVDTAYLMADYKDPGASVFEDKNGIRNCDDFTPVSNVSGDVNTRLPGSYTLSYHANDSKGNVLATVTRTVNVVENRASFLNGNYTVACTCTAVIAGSTNHTITANSYTAAIATGSVNNEFVLSSLRIGSEYVMPNCVLNDTTFGLWFYAHSFSMEGTSSGTVSASKNSFNIVSTAYQWDPRITYHCRNTYLKQLILK